MLRALACGVTVAGERGGHLGDRLERDRDRVVGDALDLGQRIAHAALDVDQPLAVGRADRDRAPVHAQAAGGDDDVGRLAVAAREHERIGLDIERVVAVQAATRTVQIDIGVRSGDAGQRERYTADQTVHGNPPVGMRPVMHTIAGAFKGCACLRLGDAWHPAGSHGRPGALPLTAVGSFEHLLQPPMAYRGR